MVVIHSIATVKAKIQDQGKKCMFLGYAQNHTGSTYHMLNIRTKRIVLICDVVRLNKPTDSTYKKSKIQRQILISYKMKTGPIFGLK